MILTGEALATTVFMSNAFKSMTGSDPNPGERGGTYLDGCQILCDEIPGEYSG